MTFRIFDLSLTTYNMMVSLFMFLITLKIYLITNYDTKNKIEEFIRVDHAGERGAVKIYEGQLLALNTLVKDDDLKKKLKK